MVCGQGLNGRAGEPLYTRAGANGGHRHVGAVRDRIPGPAARRQRLGAARVPCDVRALCQLRRGHRRAPAGARRALRKRAPLQERGAAAWPGRGAGATLHPSALTGRRHACIWLEVRRLHPPVRSRHAGRSPGRRRPALIGPIGAGAAHMRGPAQPGRPRAGIVTSLLVSLLGQARIYVVLGREGLLPARLAALHPRRATPVAATALTGVSAGAARAPPSATRPALSAGACCVGERACMPALLAQALPFSACRAREAHARCARSHAGQKHVLKCCRAVRQQQSFTEGTPVHSQACLGASSTWGRWRPWRRGQF